MCLDSLNVFPLVSALLVSIWWQGLELPPMSVLSSWAVCQWFTSYNCWGLRRALWTHVLFSKTVWTMMAGHVMRSWIGFFPCSGSPYAPSPPLGLISLTKAGQVQCCQRAQFCDAYMKCQTDGCKNRLFYRIQWTYGPIWAYSKVCINIVCVYRPYYNLHRCWSVTGGSGDQST